MNEVAGLLSPFDPWDRPVGNPRWALERKHQIENPCVSTMALQIFYIRHGETEWALNGRHTGKTEIPLTEHGEQEARKLGTRLPKDQFTHVLSSPRLRAQRTCELMGLAATMEIESDLGEWDYGEYEGLRATEIRKTRSNWNIFRDGCPGGESPAEIVARIDRVISRVRKFDGVVAVFGHSHFGRSLAARWIGADVSLGEHLLLGTTSLSVLEWDPSSPATAAISLWNAEAAHLCDVHVPLGDTRSMKQRALERWENEGGELPARKD
jgi:broad specificity phosphatase PhoE